MQLTGSDYLLWGVTALLEGFLCALIVRRGLYRRLPFFSTYLALAFARGILLWWAYHHLGSGSRAAWYIAWVTQGIPLVARGLAIAELCWSSLRAYRGIWALSWRLLWGVALLLLAYAALSAFGSRYWIAAFILAAERGLEMAAVVVLLSLLFVSGYYRIQLDAVHRKVVLGLGLYSLIQAVNDTALQAYLVRYFFWWKEVRLVSFQVALVIWLVALRKPLPATAPAPTLLPQRVYDELSPQVNYRLRILNQRLLEILKS